MFFLNTQHEKNFNHITTMIFKNAKNDREYKALAYILSLPEIYTRCINDKMLYEFPLLWTVDYIDTSHHEQDDDGEYFVLDFEVKKDNEGREISSEQYASLSHGYQLMIDYAANLFNSSNDDFNLTSSFSTWDENLVKVFFQALMIRFPIEVEGLNINLK